MKNNKAISKTSSSKYLLAYHGTNKKNANSIKKTGFRKGTYFAYYKEDAIKFGGDHIFTVRFLKDPKKWKGEKDGWQFHLRDHHSIDHIEKYEFIIKPSLYNTMER